MVTFFGDLSTCDSCFFLLPIAYTWEDMFFPECNAWDGFIRLICIQYGLYGHILPNWSTSRFHIKMDNPSLVYSTVWKRPAFQSWAYWRHASKRTEFSFCRRVDNKGHFIWARFPRSRLTSKSFVIIFLCVHMRGWAGSAPEISVFPIRISVSGLEILPYEHFSPVTGMKAGWILELNSSPVFFTFSHLRNRAQNSHMNPRRNSSR